MTDTTNRPEIVGLKEIAELLGVHRQTVKNWRGRGVLPDPLPGTASGAPVYVRSEVLDWWETYTPATRGSRSRAVRDARSTANI